MIDKIGNSGAAGLAQMALQGTAKASSTAAVQSDKTADAQAPASPAATLAAQGAPVDTDKVARIRAAILAGTYKVDPQAIAGKMIDLDLPGSSQ